MNMPLFNIFVRVREYILYYTKKNFKLQFPTISKR